MFQTWTEYNFNGQKPLSLALIQKTLGAHKGMFSLNGLNILYILEENASMEHYIIFSNLLNTFLCGKNYGRTLSATNE
jgi:hypothetical protein